MSFLITGHPRCRTAWLSALLAAHGSPCVHDALIRSAEDTPEGWGISDPGFALHFPEQAARWVKSQHAIPAIVIVRDHARQAFQEEFGRVSDSSWERMQKNLEKFKLHVPHKEYHVDQLKDNEIVGEIIELCTKQVPSLQIISTFQQLQITQHLGVAKHRFNSKTGPSILGT